MSKHVPLMRLVERVNDQGEDVLSGNLGMAEVVGRRGRPTNAGNETWLILLVEPDERAKELRRNRRQRARAEGVVELGGVDG